MKKKKATVGRAKKLWTHFYPPQISTTILTREYCRKSLAKTFFLGGGGVNFLLARVCVYCTERLYGALEAEKGISYKIPRVEMRG